MSGAAAFEKKIRTAGRVGPGGMGCPCCGPSPSHRRQWERVSRRKAKAFWKTEVSREVADAKSAD
jgi:hypothetical protein